MMIWLLSRAASLSANSRNEMSDTDPAAKGETIQIAPAGDLTGSVPCAVATNSPVASSAAAQIPAHHVHMRRLGRLGAGIIPSSLLRSTDPSIVPPEFDRSRHSHARIALCGTLCELAHCAGCRFRLGQAYRPERQPHGDRPMN